MERGFIITLRILVEEAKTNTDKLRGSEEGRNWAIVRTDLEKTLAYAEKFIKEN